MYRAITITKGSAGWGGPLSMKPTDKRNKVVSVTGGGIHPVAAKIAEMSGATPVDGFSTGVPDDEIMVVVIDCGGTARCGVYPKKKLYTVNLTAVGQSGPLAKFITEDLYVSDVTESCISYADDTYADIAKAIYRMCVIGLIDDFTQDYSKRTFRILSTRKKNGQYYERLKEFLM